MIGVHARRGGSRRARARLAVALMLLFDAIPAQTLRVDSVADGADAQPGDGLCAAAGGACTLRAAIQESNASAGPQRIELPAGTFRLAIAGADENLAALGDLDVTDGVDVVGADDGGSTVDAMGLDRAFDIGPAGAAGVVRFERVTITGGDVDATADGAGSGGGIRIGPSATLELVDVVVVGNVARVQGGGIDNRGTLDMRRSHIEGNVVDDGVGGGLATGGSASAMAVLVESVVRGNAGAHRGGGIATVRGAAGTPSAASFGTLRIERSAIVDNEALTGSAFYADAGGQFTLRESTVSGNHAFSAAAMFIDNFCDTRIESSTIVGNTAGSTTGGLVNLHGPAAPNLVVTRSILAANLPRACSGWVPSGGHNLVDGTAGCAWQPAAGDVIGVSAALGARIDDALATPHHLPLPGSPIIDAAGAGCAALDQRGSMRPRDGNGDGVAACDIGAIEVDDDALHGDGFE